MENVDKRLRHFLENSSYMENGGIVTDLDGSVVHEEKGRARIPVPVEAALKELYDLGCPLIINTLRFPLSVIRTFGREWYALAGSPIPLVTLNGSQTGFVTLKDDELVFQELDAIPLGRQEIEEILTGVAGLLNGGIRDILVFFYPRDWREGEVVWTPVPEKVPFIRKKYCSASSVTAVEFEKLRAQLRSEDICMIFLLINVAEDQLMAYQHQKRSSFFTHKGADKLSGARRFAAHLNIDLRNSLGAGDSEMDQFLKGVGCAALVGNGAYQFNGLIETIKLRNVLELGETLFLLASLQRERR